MSTKLTRNDAYFLGNRCIICAPGNWGTPNVNGHPAKELGHNEGVYGWNWTLYELDYGVVLVNGYRNFPRGDNEQAIGARERHILDNYPNFEQVENSGLHDLWRVTDRDGHNFTFDAYNGFSVVG